MLIGSYLKLPWAPTALDKQLSLLDFSPGLRIAGAGIPPGAPHLPIHIKPKCALRLPPGIPALLCSQSLKCLPMSSGISSRFEQLWRLATLQAGLATLAAKWLLILPYGL